MKELNRLARRDQRISELEADDDYCLIQIGNDNHCELQLFVGVLLIHSPGFKQSIDSLNSHKELMWDGRFFYYARHLVKTAQSYEDLSRAWAVRDLILDQVQLSSNSYLMTDKALIYQAALARIVSLGCADDKVEASVILREKVLHMR